MPAYINGNDFITKEETVYLATRNFIGMPTQWYLDAGTDEDHPISADELWDYNDSAYKTEVDEALRVGIIYGDDSRNIRLKEPVTLQDIRTILERTVSVYLVTDDNAAELSAITFIAVLTMVMLCLFYMNLF